jgi:ribose transport system substrate-binding protein
LHDKNNLPLPAKSFRRVEMKKLRTVVFGMVVLAVLCTAAACTKKQGEEKIQIGFVLMSRTTEFLVGEEFGAIDEAKKYPEIELIMIDGESSNEKQVAATEDLITRGAKAIVLNPYNSDGISAAVKRANEKNIPLVDVDSFANGGTIDVHVGFDNAEAGRLAAAYLGEVLGGKGKVLEIRGPLGLIHADNRYKGFHEVMDARYPDIQVITMEAQEWASDRGREITMDALTANPDLAAIYSHSDNMMIGAVPALEQSGRLFPIGDPKHIPVASIDAAPFGVSAVGNGYIDVTFSQDPIWMGREAVKAAVALAKGEKPASVAESTPIRVTKENANDPGLWANQFSQK